MTNIFLETLVVGWFVLITGTAGLQWTTSYQEGDIIYACEHDSITFNFSFTPDVGEQVLEIQWFYDGRSHELMAMLAADNFIPLPAYSMRVQHLSDAAVVLKNLVEEDTGNYTVEISFDDSAGTMVRMKRSVQLRVGTGKEAPVVAGGNLTASQNDIAVKDETTGQWHIVLTCGTLTSRGEPPVDVVWTTSTGQTFPSSKEVGGKFTFIVPNPVTGGSFGCYIPPESPAVKCIPSDASILREASVTIDSIEARLSLLEARDEDLQSENSHLLQQLETANQTIDSLESHVSSLDSQLDSFKNFNAFFERLFPIRDVRLSGGTTHSGRIEVQLANGSWVLLCDDYVGSYDAVVICGSLGFSRTSPSVITNAALRYGHGSLPVWPHRLDCTGSEAHVSMCSVGNLTSSEIQRCDHADEAGVSCHA